MEVNPYIEKLLKETQTPLRWVFTGASIISGALHTFGYRDFTELFRERVYWEMRRSRDQFLNSAFGSGMTAKAVLNDFSFRVAHFKPNVCFIMVGGNDARKNEPLDDYRNQLRTLCGKIRELEGYPVLITTIPTGEAIIADYVAAMREVAAEQQAGLLDFNASWPAGAKGVYLKSDPLHPNAEGHILLAHELFRYCGIWDPNSVMCRYDNGLQL